MGFLRAPTNSPVLLLVKFLVKLPLTSVEAELVSPSESYKHLNVVTQKMASSTL